MMNLIIIVKKIIPYGFFWYKKIFKALSKLISKLSKNILSEKDIYKMY